MNGYYRDEEALLQPNGQGTPDPIRNAWEEPQRPEGWPVLSETALYGPAGTIVKTILPVTEADSAALLANLLSGFGSIAGRNCYVEADGFEHYPIINFVTVGETCAGVKGTAKRRMTPVLELLDPAWAKNCIQHGLSSGEGLIAHLQMSDDPGKRLFIVEEEFSKVLACMKREGSTLSQTLRQSWDSGDLKIMTRKDPVSVEDAHVTTTGHITPRELQKRMDETEIANGLANRFLWLLSHRSKYLPNGGSLSLHQLTEMAKLLQPAVAFAKQPRRVCRTPQAEKLWASKYRRLADGEDGLVGEVLARGRPQVMRLALVFALLDRSKVIAVAHMKAAFAVWDYCRESAYVLFGDALGDPIADAILRALREQEGMDRTQIRDLFHRHAKAESINLALATLKAKGLATTETIPSNGGRTTEFWTATKATKATYST
jgi:hypothetical protein